MSTMFVEVAGVSTIVRGVANADGSASLPVTAAAARSGAPSAPVAFTATNPAVALTAATTAYTGGFTVTNTGATTMYLTTVGAVAAGGIQVVAGATATVPYADAHVWGAFAAAPCAGSVMGVVVP